MHCVVRSKPRHWLTIWLGLSMVAIFFAMAWPVAANPEGQWDDNYVPVVTCAEAGEEADGVARICAEWLTPDGERPYEPCCIPEGTEPHDFSACPNPVSTRPGTEF